jgi:hypothetical protein
MADDFNYLDVASQPLTDFIHYLVNHYFTWGGRVLAHFFAGLSLSARSALVFAFLNSIIFLLTLLLAKNLIFRKNTEKPVSPEFYFILIIFGFSIFAKSNLQTIFWQIGAANYFWMFFLLVWFLNLFHDWILEGKALVLPINTGHTYLCLSLAILIGATNENVGLALLGLIAWQYLQRLRLKEKLIGSYAEVLVSFLVLISTVFLLIAPGNKVRSLVTDPNGPPPILERLKWWSESFFIFFGRPDGIIFLVACGFLFARYKISRAELVKQVKNRGAAQSLLILSLLLALVFLGHNGNFYDRKSFNIGWIFVLAAIALWQNAIAITKPLTAEKPPYETNWLLGFFMLLPLLRAGVDFKKIVDFNHEVRAREENLLQQNQKNQQTQQDQQTQQILIAPILNNPYGLEDLTEDPTHWINGSYAKYLKVNPIQGVKNR